MLSDDEEYRLATLAALKLLDTPPDTHFDNLVRLAADLFDVPIALVSLVDRDRQWFKASVGMTMRETPREDAFCSHAIEQPGTVLVVEDASRDPRFADNPLVRGAPGIRFYAGAPFCAPNGQPIGTLCIIDRKPRQITDAERQRLATLAQGVAAMVDLHRSTIDLRHAATHDPLTGLPNRILFDARLETAVQDALEGRPCAVLLADLDSFKPVNDRLGHEAGDELLAQVANRLLEAVRSCDVVARLGGDEFAILLAGPIDAATAARIAGRIVEQACAPYRLARGTVSVGMSIGTALCPLDALDERALMLAADTALYEAKATGGGSGQVTPARATTGRAMDADLRRATANGELLLHWQPYFRTDTGAVHGFEALLRWHHPVRGAVAPSRFLPLAEASGLIANIDRWVLHQACRAAAAWPGRQHAAVNLSAFWFNKGGVLDHVRDALAETGLAPERLVLEVTERTLISSRDVARAEMDRLRGMGVRLALDDFGIGYSSLSYLRHFPFTMVKLDRAFVAALGEDPKADAVARAIIQLGHALAMQVSGEGVETAAQLAFLAREGCEFAQGYLLGRPAAAPCVRAWRVAA
jgi:diguanylate cyclase (GGDEF)-like protein